MKSTVRLLLNAWIYSNYKKYSYVVVFIAAFIYQLISPMVVKKKPQVYYVSYDLRFAFCQWFFFTKIFPDQFPRNLLHPARFSVHTVYISRYRGKWFARNTAEK